MLKILLKPFEKVIINNAVIVGGDKKTELTVMNDAIILREKDVLTEENANTPSKRLYFVVQCMYLEGSFEASKKYHPLFNQLLRDWINACPSTLEICMDLGEQIMAEDFFKALKSCKKLIEHEEKVTKYV